MVRDDQTDFGDQDPDNVTVCSSGDTLSEAPTIADDNATLVPDDVSEATVDDCLNVPCPTVQQRPQPCQRPEGEGKHPEGGQQLEGVGQQREEKVQLMGEHADSFQSKAVTTSQSNPQVDLEQTSLGSTPAASSTESPRVSSVPASSLECDARPRGTRKERKKNRRELDADPNEDHCKDHFVSHRHYEREVLGKKKGRGGKKQWKRYW